MSNLSSLFSMGIGGGGGGSLDGDALKYSAPKEPKRKVSIKLEADPKPSPVAATIPSQKPVAPAPVQQSKPLGPSKVMASAAVRLYKINQSTRVYEPVENSAMLGCAILGTGLNFQILVYNAQKVPQAAVSISGTFDYTVRDFYVSFADSSGNFWSLLFDNLESMMNVLRVVSSIIFHLNTHNDSTTESLRRLLPRNPDTPVDETLLSAGMTAGIHLEVFEVGEQADYPGDILQTPIKRIVVPDDVLKVKVGSSEFIAGLSESLVGLTKGDRCMIGVSPRLFYQPVANELINMAERKFPTNWVILQVEIVKIKSSEVKKKDKKMKEEDMIVAVVAPAAVAAAPETPVETHTADIKSRMARVAAAGGASQQLGSIFGGMKLAATNEAPAAPAPTPISVTPVSVASAAVAIQEEVSISAAPAAVSVAAQPLPQPSFKHQVVTTAAAATSPIQTSSVAAPAYRPQDSVLAQKEAMLQQSQDTINQQMLNSVASPAYAVAIAAESSTLSDTSGMQSRNMVMMLENNQQSQQQYFNQFQQSMMIIQQSMMQMQTKLDQVGMSVNNTFSLVQQQSSTVALSSNSNGMNMGGMNGMGMGFGMGGMGGMGMMNMGGMNMGGMGGMNPMAMGGMGGVNPMMMQQMNYGGAGMNAGPYGLNPVRGKVEELVSTAQFLVQQYDQIKRENDELQQGGASQQEVQSLQEQINVFRSKVAEIETQRSQWQREKEQMTGTIDTLRLENTRLGNDLATLKNSVPNLDSPEIEAHVQSRLKEHESSYLLRIKDLENELEQSRQNSSQKVAALETEVIGLKQACLDIEARAEKDLFEATSNLPQSSISPSDSEEKVQKLEQEIATLQSQLLIAQQSQNAAEKAFADSKLEIEGNRNGDNSEKLAELQQKIDQLEASLANGGTGKFSDDDIKLCMQEVYILAASSFITSEELESVEDETRRDTMAQVTKLNLKRLKEALRQVTTNKLG